MDWIHSDSISLNFRINSEAAINELDTPTKASEVPTENKRWDSFSPTNASSIEAKLGYLKLNIPAACPPHTVFPVNTRARFCEFISSQHARFAFGEGCDHPGYVSAKYSPGCFGGKVGIARKSMIGWQTVQQFQRGLEIRLNRQRAVRRRSRFIIVSIARQNHRPHIGNMRIIRHGSFRMVKGL